MRVLVTGAGGFIGSVLVDAIGRCGQIGNERVEALAVLDRELPRIDGAGIVKIAGDIAEPAVHWQVVAFAPDVVFHLAAVPGGAAEADYSLGRRVNLEATLALFEALATFKVPPVVVYASSVAVYGANLPDPVTPQTPLRPAITYGAHKQACEVLLADFSRRGLIDGRSVRLPGIVARPRAASGLVSAFMSDLLHALRAGERFTCPVGPRATAWWMSARRCADNLLQAATMAVPGTDTARAWPLPVLRLSIEEVVATLAGLFGEDRRGLVTYEPQPMVEAVFGRYPRLDDAAARALGLRDDGDARQLVLRALGTPEDKIPKETP